MADVEPPLSSGGVRVANGIDGAAVGQQIVELRPIGEFVDPRQIDKQQPPRVGERGIELIEVHRLPTVNGAYTNKVTLFAHHVDQLNCLNMEATGSKPRPTSGLVSIEMLNGADAANATASPDRRADHGRFEK